MLHCDQRQVNSDSQCQTPASGFSQFFFAISLLQSSGPIFSARLHTGPTLSLLAPTSAAEVLKLLTLRPLKSSPVDRAAVSPAAFVCYHLCADHITHGQPVVRQVLLPGGVQDSTGTAFAQEARTSRQGADVQLPADIQPENHLEGD